MIVFIDYVVLIFYDFRENKYNVEILCVEGLNEVIYILVD